MNAKTQRGTRRLAVEGDLTVYGAAALKKRLLDALARATQLEVDLSRVAEVDTAGMQVLILAKREALKAGKSLRLSGHSPAILDALDLFDLGAYFGDPVFISKEGASRARSKSSHRSRA